MKACLAKDGYLMAVQILLLISSLFYSITVGVSWVVDKCGCLVEYAVKRENFLQNLYGFCWYFRKEVFLVICPGNRRDKATLLPIIKEKVTTNICLVVFKILYNYQVKQGTRIITDGWSAYRSLGEEGFTWEWVNHSTHFVKPGTKDIHTNRIEGLHFLLVFMVNCFM